MIASENNKCGVTVHFNIEKHIFQYTESQVKKKQKHFKTDI